MGKVALAFLAPTFVLLFVLRVLPTVQALIESFQRRASRIAEPRWVGLDNYVALFTNDGFLQVLGVTGLFILIIIPFQVISAVFLALLLNERFPGLGAARAFIFVPVAAPAAVATVVWGVAFQPQGPINAVIEAAGLPSQPFLTSPDQALLAIIVLMSWIGVGYWTLFLVAGLQDIPRDLYEAASIDGAGWWRCFFSITLPNLRRTLAFVVVANTVSSLIAFVPVAILTRGGPADSTRLIMYDTYNNTFVLGDVNLGQAEVTILLLVLIVITALQFRLLGRERES
ncbi:carbohydrate ABC transporter permease [Microbacterium hibisci]|uniref:carbohydrate ABC transporter permease n=1 Tax=Microbacterium hibisci TaxID=2036000 RepID=UPI0019443244|nr:sugar ABC transporter permease [Microbacterium hibisci]